MVLQKCDLAATILFVRISGAEMQKKFKNDILLVAGVPGAGKSTALNALEDSGFQIIDRIPLNMIPSVIRAYGEQEKSFSLGIGIDVLRDDFSEDIMRTLLDELDTFSDISVRFLFLICSDKALLRRYAITRRIHPLASSEISLAEAVAKSNEITKSYLHLATNIIDTSELTSYQLSSMIRKVFTSHTEGDMKIMLMSFSYRNGLPQEADIVLDVRCLLNPFYVEELRNLTGKDKQAADYIRQDKDFDLFIKPLKNMLSVLLPKYREEGKSYLTIAFGCTGGRHRSVFVAEEIAAWLRTEGYDCVINHRELNK